MGFVSERATRARTVSPAYAGEISATEAWDYLRCDSRAVLVDVRTPPEWVFSGEPDLGSIGKTALKISWKVFPTYAVNDRFLTSLNAEGVASDAPVFFICRTGGRSLDAAIAMTAQGFTHCYNVTDGFEGPQDAAGRRGTVAGWKASNLPWRQE